MADLEAGSLPYRHPEFYAAMTDGDVCDAAGLIKALAHLHAPVDAASVLDVGCGTGAVLEELAKTYPVAVGVDLLPGMVEIASAKRAHLDVRCGDMRTVRLGQVFEIVVCVGNALAYMTSDEDLRAAFATFAEHTAPGGLLLIKTLTTFPTLDVTKTGVVIAGGRTAKTAVTYRRDPADGVLIMDREWDFEDGDSGRDELRRRVLTLEELTAFADDAHFSPADWPEVMPDATAVFLRRSRL